MNVYLIKINIQLVKHSRTRVHATRTMWSTENINLNQVLEVNLNISQVPEQLSRSGSLSARQEVSSSAWGLNDPGSVERTGLNKSTKVVSYSGPDEILIPSCRRKLFVPTGYS